MTMLAESTTASNNNHLTTEDIYLGPAVVIAVDIGQFTVTYAGKLCVAKPAFSIAYQPQIGDVLLIMAQYSRAGAVYAVGVLNGRGASSITAHGDLTISAPHGRIKLNAGDAIEMTAPQMRLQAQSLELIATAFMQRVQTALLAVADLFHLSAGSKVEKITGSSLEHAETRHQLTTKETIINASTVHIS